MAKSKRYPHRATEREVIDNAPALAVVVKMAAHVQRRAKPAPRVRAGWRGVAA